MILKFYREVWYVFVAHTSESGRFYAKKKKSFFSTNVIVEKDPNFMATFWVANHVSMFLIFLIFAFFRLTFFLFSSAFYISKPIFYPPVEVCGMFVDYFCCRYLAQLALRQLGLPVPSAGPKRGCLNVGA